jgi:DNA-binding transcriptional ArsR family regulator
MLFSPDIFQVLADPTRRAILLLVFSPFMTAGALSSNFDAARPTVQKHLQILAQSEIFEQKQNSRKICYPLDAKQMKVLAAYVEQFSKIRDDRCSKWAAIIKNTNQINRILWNKDKKSMPRTAKGN